MTPGLRRRRELADHHKSLLNGSGTDLLSDTIQKDSSNLIPLGRSLSGSGKKDSFGSIPAPPSILEQQNNLKNSSSNGSFTNGTCGSPNGTNITVARWDIVNFSC